MMWCVYFTGWLWDCSWTLRHWGSSYSVQSQKAVIAYFTREQILYFRLAEQHLYIGGNHSIMTNKCKNIFRSHINEVTGKYTLQVVYKCFLPLWAAFLTMRRIYIGISPYRTLTVVEPHFMADISHMWLEPVRKYKHCSFFVRYGKMQHLSNE